MTIRETAVVALFVVTLACAPVGAAGGNPVRDESEQSVPSVALPPQNATVDGAPFLRLDNGQERVGGTTTVTPGQNVTVVVAGSGFERTKSVTVSQDGRYSATFDFSNVDTPLAVTVDVRAGGTSILGNGAVPGRIAVRPASIVVTSQTTDGTSVQIRRVNLPDGGFIVAHRNGVDGEVLGVASRDPGFGSQLVVPLDPPINGTTEMTLALYRDTNGNGTYDPGDQPYTADGSQVTGQSTVSVETTTTAANPTTTDGGDATTTTAGGPGTTTTTGGTATTGPGFGAVTALLALAVSFVGVLGGRFSRRRRR